MLWGLGGAAAVGCDGGVGLPFGRPSNAAKPPGGLTAAAGPTAGACPAVRALPTAGAVPGAGAAAVVGPALPPTAEALPTTNAIPNGVAPELAGADEVDAAPFGSPLVAGTAVDGMVAGTAELWMPVSVLGSSVAGAVFALCPGTAARSPGVVLGWLAVALLCGGGG